jgi:hypothetical protein
LIFAAVSLKVPKFRVNTDRPIRETHVDRLASSEFRVWENWKCASVETLEALKPKEPKWWGMMTSPGGDVDPKILK